MRGLPRRGSSRCVWAILVMVLVAGCGLGGGGSTGGGSSVDVAATRPTPTDDPSASADADPQRPDGAAQAGTPADATSGRPTRTPSRKPRKPARKPAPRSSSTGSTPDDQVWDQRPACATFEGRAVSKAKVKSALAAAAGRVYWQTSAPQLKVPSRLVRAIAWQESGWQSNIVNCDGGRGVMQAMPDTVAHMNQRFGVSYDATDYRDNAFFGANYLAWLTKKFGDNYFDGRYDLSAGRCRSASDMCLLNMVIAGYNAGDGGVESGHDSGQLPNPGYVDSVRALMRRCPCDRY